MAEATLRRSVLYLPGANERALEKAKNLPADALVFDLEDAVAPQAKLAARARVCAAVASGVAGTSGVLGARGDYGDRELVIRINGMGTEWYEADLHEALDAGPNAIVVPKINSADEVREIERALERHSAGERTTIWAMLETPASVLHAGAIAAASERLSVLVMGTNDLATELHVATTGDRGPLLAALSQCVLAARAAGKTILDGVYNNIHDSAGFTAECQQGKQFGFDGKTLIHPNQLAECNRIYTPSQDDIEHARQVIEAINQAKAEGKSVATLNGHLIEPLHAKTAKQTLATANAIKTRTKTQS